MNKDKEIKNLLGSLLVQPNSEKKQEVKAKFIRLAEENLSKHADTVPQKKEMGSVAMKLKEIFTKQRLQGCIAGVLIMCVTAGAVWSSPGGRSLLRGSLVSEAEPAAVQSAPGSTPAAMQTAGEGGEEWETMSVPCTPSKIRFQDVKDTEFTITIPAELLRQVAEGKGIETGGGETETGTQQKEPDEEPQETEPESDVTGEVSGVSWNSGMFSTNVMAAESAPENSDGGSDGNSGDSSESSASENAESLETSEQSTEEQGAETPGETPAESEKSTSEEIEETEAPAAAEVIPGAEAGVPAETEASSEITLSPETIMLSGAFMGMEIDSFDYTDDILRLTLKGEPIALFNSDDPKGYIAIIPWENEKLAFVSEIETDIPSFNAKMNTLRAAIGEDIDTELRFELKDDSFIGSPSPNDFALAGGFETLNVSGAEQSGNEISVFVTGRISGYGENGIVTLAGSALQSGITHSVSFAISEPAELKPIGPLAPGESPQTIVFLLDYDKFADYLSPDVIELDGALSGLSVSSVTAEEGFILTLTLTGTPNEGTGAVKLGGEALESGNSVSAEVVVVKQDVPETEVFIDDEFIPPTPSNGIGEGLITGWIGDLTQSTLKTGLTALSEGREREGWYDILVTIGLVDETSKKLDKISGQIDALIEQLRDTEGRIEAAIKASEHAVSYRNFGTAAKNNIHFLFKEYVKALNKPTESEKEAAIRDIFGKDGKYRFQVDQLASNLENLRDVLDNDDPDCESMISLYATVSRNKEPFEHQAARLTRYYANRMALYQIETVTLLVDYCEYRAKIADQDAKAEKDPKKKADFVADAKKQRDDIKDLLVDLEESLEKQSKVLSNELKNAETLDYYANDGTDGIVLRLNSNNMYYVFYNKTYRALAGQTGAVVTCNASTTEEERSRYKFNYATDLTNMPYLTYDCLNCIYNKVPNHGGIDTIKERRSFMNDLVKARDASGKGKTMKQFINDCLSGTAYEGKAYVSSDMVYFANSEPFEWPFVGYDEEVWFVNMNSVSSDVNYWNGALKKEFASEIYRGERPIKNYGNHSVLRVLSERPPLPAKK